jgi:glycerol-3-phosphate dehydrogenase
VFPRDRLPVAEAAAFIPDIDRRRFLFVIPWHDSVLVGTTDSTYEGSLDHPSVDASDREYCIDSLNRVFDLDLTETDISGAFAGLRPLIAGKAGATADLSRRHAVYPISPGILGITGGKLTTYRRMSMDAVDHVVEDLGAASKSRTRWIRLGSSDPTALRLALQRRALRVGLGPDVVGNLVRTYGDRALAVMDQVESEGGAEPLVDGHASIVAESTFGARHEMVATLSDLLARRTRLALIDPAAGIGAASRATNALAKELRWSKKTASEHVAAHRADIETERGMSLYEPSHRDPSEEKLETG